MNNELLSHLACANCSDGRFDNLSSAIRDIEQLGSGELVCASCRQSYRVVDGIARFVPESNYANSFGYQWNLHAATQLDSHCNITVSRDRVFSVTQWPERLEGQLVLEAGSGAGRFTEILASTGASVLSFDFSKAVDANKRNNGANDNLLIFQGNIFNIPVPDRSMDKVFCLGVIQHTPDPKKAFLSLASKVKAGGSLVIDVYALDLKARLQWKYVLRPITKRMNNQRLHAIVSRIAPMLVGPTRLLRKIAGRAGARLSPIVEYSYLGLDDRTNREWAILDTFDMYSPAHDHPQSLATVKSWFEEIGFESVEVCRGPNGVVGRGSRPLS
jgi:SAM-dependent methyltransferase